MHLRVAGFTIHVTCADRDLPLAAGRESVPFLVEPAPPDVQITVAWGDGSDDGAGDCLFDSGGSWRLYRHADGYLFRFFSSMLESSPYKTALFNRDFSVGQVRLHRDFFAGASSIDPLEYPLDELLVISLLSQGRGVEIHGCGLVDGSVGYLFVGQSGAGKSTMARLWLGDSGVAILSDDRVVLRSDADGIWMYGTPWHGEEPLASPRRARLSRLFFLHHSERQELVPVTRSASVAHLFAASFPPFHDASALDFTLRFLDGVVTRVPCMELGFSPEPTVLDFVRTAGLAGRGGADRAH